MLVSETATWGCLYTGTKTVLRKKKYQEKDPRKQGKNNFPYIQCLLNSNILTFNLKQPLLAPLIILSFD